jgi:hypothetical protein
MKIALVLSLHENLRDILRRKTILEATLKDGVENETMSIVEVFLCERRSREYEQADQKYEVELHVAV